MADEKKSPDGFYAEENAGGDKSDRKSDQTAVVSSVDKTVAVPSDPQSAQSDRSDQTEAQSDAQSEAKKYFIRVTSPDGSKERQIKLSSGLFKFGVFSAMLGAFLLIGTAGFTIYSALNFRLNQAAVTDMERATELQQEQLLTLSKKAGKLSDQLQNLTQMENELRIQAGMTPIVEKKVEEVPPPTEGSIEGSPTEGSTEASTDQSDQTQSTDQTQSDQTQSDQTEVDSDEEYDGQGGPIEDLSLDNVGEALKSLEDGLIERRASLEELQYALKQQREQIAVIANQRNAVIPPMTTTITMPDSGISFANGPVSNNSFALGLTSAAPNVPAIWPTTGVVSSPYGLRWGGTDFHPGIDIANDMGTPIVATADGLIIYAGWNAGGYGNMVDIDHGNGLMTRYGHASQVLVSAGQYVKRGQVIALMGSTGFSTGPHVHYEVHVNGKQVNPVSYL